MVENKPEEKNNSTVEQILGSQVLKILYMKGVMVKTGPNGSITGSVLSSSPLGQSIDLLTNVKIADVTIHADECVKGEICERNMI